MEPFASLATLPSGRVPRLLLNRELVGPFKHRQRRPTDVAMTGDLVESVVTLVQGAGWGVEFQALQGEGEGEGEKAEASTTEGAEVSKVEGEGPKTEKGGVEGEGPKAEIGKLVEDLAVLSLETNKDGQVIGGCGGDDTGSKGAGSGARDGCGSGDDKGAGSGARDGCGSGDDKDGGGGARDGCGSGDDKDGGGGARDGCGSGDDKGAGGRARDGCGSVVVPVEGGEPRRRDVVKGCDNLSWRIKAWPSASKPARQD